MLDRKNQNLLSFKTSWVAYWILIINTKTTIQFNSHTHSLTHNEFIKVPMKRNFLFDIFVDKGLKFRAFLQLQFSVKHDKSYATNSTWSEICT